MPGLRLPCGGPRQRWCSRFVMIANQERPGRPLGLRDWRRRDESRRRRRGRRSTKVWLVAHIDSKNQQQRTSRRGRRYGPGPQSRHARHASSAFSRGPRFTGPSPEHGRTFRRMRLCWMGGFALSGVGRAGDFSDACRVGSKQRMGRGEQLRRGSVPACPRRGPRWVAREK